MTTHSRGNRASDDIACMLCLRITLVTGAIAAIVGAPLVPLCASILRDGFGLSTGGDALNVLLMLPAGYAFAAILGAPFSAAIGVAGGAVLVWRSRVVANATRLFVEALVAGALLGSLGAFIAGGAVRPSNCEVIASAAGVGACAAAATFLVSRHISRARS